MIDFLIFALKAILVALFAVIVGGYAYFVWSGELPNPFAQMPPTAAVNSAAASILYLAVGLSCLLAVLAPLIYALRSGDLFTVVVSIVALVACFTILTFSRTVIDMVLAAIVYFTSAFISVLMFAADRIVKEIRRTAATTEPIIEPPYHNLTER